LQVAIEDNQNINEGYTSTMSFRTRDAIAVGGADLNTLAYFGGASSPTKKRLIMFGVNGGDDYATLTTYTLWDAEYSRMVVKSTKSLARSIPQQLLSSKPNVYPATKAGYS
jgi:hypothetical protein